MKNPFFAIAITLAFLSCSNAFAQIKQSMDISYSAFGNFVDESGHKISPKEITDYLTAYEYADYKTSRTKLITGYIFAGVAVANATAAIIQAERGGHQEHLEENPYAANIIIEAAVFDVCVPIALVKILRGHNGLKKVSKAHNSYSNDVAFNFGSTQNGIGLTVSF